MISTISEIAMLWQKVLKILEKKLDEKQIFDVFFADSYIHEINNETIIVVANSQVAVTLMNNRYKDLIIETIEEVTQSHFNVVFLEASEIQNTKGPTPVAVKKVEYFKDARINPDSTFDNFVMGNFNREAGQAALMIAANPGKMFNPLYIYSNSGLGKTHLMHAIGNYISKVTKPGAKILYFTAEDFVEEYIKFVKGEKEAENLKEYVASFDVLLLDDIQFLANKVKTQEFFFYIYEKMINNNKQIVITSDKQPSELNGIEDRLVTRFSKGLTVNIQKPDRDTCVEILKKKIISNGLSLDNVDPAVVLFYADKFSNNIRELEGAFTRLIFYAVKFKQANTISMDLAVEAVQNIMGMEKMDGQLSGTKIINVTADYYNLAPSQLTGKIRTGQIALARHMAMYLIRYHTDLPLKKIGDLFGGKDHTTVMNAIEKVEKELKTNTQVKEAISELQKRLNIK